jgi:hypothetical protein
MAKDTMFSKAGTEIGKFYYQETKLLKYTRVLLQRYS